MERSQLLQIKGKQYLQVYDRTQSLKSQECHMSIQHPEMRAVTFQPVDIKGTLLHALALNLGIEYKL